MKETTGSNTVTAGNCSTSHEEIIQAKFEKEALESLKGLNGQLHDVPFNS